MNRPRSAPVPKGFPEGVLSKPIGATVIFPYVARDALEMNLRRDQRVQISERRGDWWYIARTVSGEEVWIPSSYVRLDRPPISGQVRELYKEWRAGVEDALCHPKHGEQMHKVSRQTFPWIPAELCTCDKTNCKSRKANSALCACIHDVQNFMRSDEAYSAKWLWTEHLKWHPDRWGWRLHSEIEEQGLRAVGEMFVILDELSKLESNGEREDGLAEQMGGVSLGTQH